MERYLLALDQGTSASRAVVFDRAGTARGIARRELRQIFPQPGWVEHDADEIWEAQLTAARSALADAGVDASAIAAIGVTNQRETTVLWDRATGRPVHNAIVWQDRRTAEHCRELRDAGHEAAISRKTGLRLDPYFSATKIAWLLDNVEGLRTRAERGQIAFGTIDTWLLWKLTGGAVHATDYSNASRTLLFDLRALDWDDELLRVFRVPRAVLPNVRPCAADYGTTVREIFGRALPVRGVAGDQQAALAGQAGFTAGSAKNTFGTGSFAMLNTGTQIASNDQGLLATVAFSAAPREATYALEGSVFVAGAAVQWLRDGLGLIADSADVEALARSVSDAGGVYFVPAFVGLGAPRWDPHARGTILGITRGTTKAHLARATLEAIAYQTRDVVAAMERASGTAMRELRVDGGAAVDDLLMQFQADVLGADVVRPEAIETTALGAAFIAGLQSGYWRNIDEIATIWREERRFTPAMDARERKACLAGWARAVERAAGWDSPA